MGSGWKSASPPTRTFTSASKRGNADRPRQFDVFHSCAAREHCRQSPKNITASNMRRPRRRPVALHAIRLTKSAGIMAGPLTRGSRLTSPSASTRHFPRSPSLALTRTRSCARACCRQSLPRLKWTIAAAPKRKQRYLPSIGQKREHAYCATTRREHRPGLRASVLAGAAAWVCWGCSKTALTDFSHSSAGRSLTA